MRTQRTRMKKIGVIGLGNMGRGMAFSLQRGGYEVLGYDAQESTRTALAQQGVRCVDTIAALASAVEMVVLSLPTSDIVEQVVEGEGGLLQHGAPGLVIVDTTTADPNSTRRLAALLQAAGMELVDAPVSGGPKGAATATMGMVIGGSTETVARIEPVLAVMSAKRVHVGPVGAGHVAKLLNNLVTGTHLLIAGEAARIAAAAGLDVRQIFQGLALGSANSKVIEVFYPTWIFNEAFDSGFTMKLMRKDLRLAMNLIEETRSSTPLSREAGRLWARSVEGLADEEDFNRIVNYIEH
ncbi:NAD(P)-dependent oxidoreductase [Herbaspirillum sp. GW103]|uniref:NAD(P)-dependent oxidoreductase n=1 Tax=Herbaspirillum sp. GW103 TaxID=1175306 RepID=UPI0026F4041D|nr:NAD(P)-dependent oxidoreductase [Herbaspirillum sp. GW103]